MIDVALHVEDGGAAVVGDTVQVFVAVAKITVADGDAVEVASEDFADLDGGIAVGDLGGVAVNESAVSTKLGNATSSTVSTSSFVKSRSPIKSRPLKLVCII